MSGLELVYGGADVGLMGELANAVITGGAKMGRPGENQLMSLA